MGKEKRWKKTIEKEHGGTLVRGHWEVENRPHRQLDFTFRDDKNTSMETTEAKTCRL